MAAATKSGAARDRPTAWWVAMLEKRALRMYEEHLDPNARIEWASEAEREAAIRFFNAAYRAEESGLRQAHELADEIRPHDPELARCLKLYGDEEGWHRELLVELLKIIGGEVRPMGRMTGTFYKVYGRAERMESIVLTNLMFETIGSTTYRLALRKARYPLIRQILTILTRDESFHVPLNVHFLREILKRRPDSSRWRLQAVYHIVYVALLGSAAASRKAAAKFDGITFRELSTAYAEQLGRLFLHESDLALTPSATLLRLFGLRRDELARAGAVPAVSIEAAERAADRSQVEVTAL